MISGDGIDGIDTFPIIDKCTDFLKHKQFSVYIQ